MAAVRKIRSLLVLGGSVMGAASAVSEFKSAKQKKDGLALANAIASVLVVITGALLALRGLGKGDGA